MSLPLVEDLLLLIFFNVAILFCVPSRKLPITADAMIEAMMTNLPTDNFRSAEGTTCFMFLLQQRSNVVTGSICRDVWDFCGMNNSILQVS